MEISKYKKYHKQKKVGKNEKSYLRNIKKGFYGLKVIESGIITPKHIEMARRVISRITKRIGKIFINVFCNYPLTKKPLLSRMGKGSGLINTWVAYVKKGKIIIEVKGVPKKLVFIAFKIIKYRIAIKMNIINRYVVDV